MSTKRKSWETIPRTPFNKVKYYVCKTVYMAFVRFYKVTGTGNKPLNSRSTQGRCLDFYSTWDFQDSLPETFGLERKHNEQ